MALQLFFSGTSFEVFRRRWLRYAYAHSPCSLLVCSAALIGAVSATAQTPQQQYVYASVSPTSTTSEVVGFVKDGTSGALTRFSSSPFSDPRFQGGAMAIDGLGQFLFVIDQNSSIWMLQIDQSGNLTNASASPFAPVGPTGAICLATEKSGRFLYVGYSSGIPSGHGAIVAFHIDTTDPQNPQLISIGNTDISSAPVGLVTDSEGYLYAGLRGSGGQGDGTEVYSIDNSQTSSAGQLTIVGFAGSGLPERGIAIDPQGMFFFDDGGGGLGEGFIESAVISGSGTTSSVASTIVLDQSTLPSALLIDNSGKFLYVELSNGTAVYSIAENGALLATQASTSMLSINRDTAKGDPQGPYIYSMQADGIHGFQIQADRLGLLVPLPISPFSDSGATVGLGGLAISGLPVQAATGPAAQFSPAAQDFGGVTVGQSSDPQTLVLRNTGGQTLGLAPIKVVGANEGDFTATQSCPSSLPPNSGAGSTCSVSVIFTPSAIGLRQASLMANDTAGVQSAQLTGMGVATESAVTFTPGSVSFPSTAQGATSAAQTLTVTSSGAATLHISSAVPSGTNPSDFNVTSSCGNAVPVGTSCTVSISFSPLGDGLRTATVLVADDAPGSPQSVPLRGTGIGPPVDRPGVTVAPSTISFLPTTLGTRSAAQSVTITSSGTAPLHISSILAIGPNSSDFAYTGDCSGAVQVKASCTISVSFSPSGDGPRTATISIADDAPKSPQSLQLSGTGVDPPVLVVGTAPGGSLSATVSAGQTATYNLQLVPGFTGSVSVGCSHKITAAMCTVPAAMNVTSGVGVPFSVTVATTGTGALMLFSDTSRFKPQTLLPLATALVLLAMFLIMCSVRRTQRTARSWRLICGGAFAGLAVMMAMFAAMGCGGGSTIAQSVPITQPSVTATPAGTYTITLTFTPMATTTSVAPLAAVPPTQLTLIVN